MVDYDLFMIRFLPKFRGVVAKTKAYVKNVFLACDLDGNGICDKMEFLMIIKHIEKITKYDEINELFDKEADLVNNGEKCLSFEKFAIVCADYNIFSKEK